MSYSICVNFRICEVLTLSLILVKELSACLS